MEAAGDNDSANFWWLRKVDDVDGHPWLRPVNCAVVVSVGLVHLRSPHPPQAPPLLTRQGYDPNKSGVPAIKLLQLFVQT